jgi:1-acyl-sn-glycerol-3-phosphate acyltransferase
MRESDDRTDCDGPGPASDSIGPVHRRLRGIGRGCSTLLLDLFILKPIAIFVWWFSQRANTLHFRDRRQLLDCVKRARGERRPVIVALNHVSWFDDPVIPMALYRTGARAALEVLALGVLLAACWLLPSDWLPRPAGTLIWITAAAVAARFGARKVWWTLGDQVNLSDASVLRGKFALTRDEPPGPLLRALLFAADSAIPWFMHSGTTKTVFVDRRPGEAAKRSRARAVDETVAIAARLEPVWVFFEGGRSRVPGVIAPARRGVGALVLALHERAERSGSLGRAAANAQRPLVVVVCHRGMERLIPPGGSRFLSFGHRVEVRWSLLDLPASLLAAGDDQAIADAVRETAVQLQASDAEGGASGA